jgi:predicted DNA-binding transcriptional regulator AlpA
MSPPLEILLDTRELAKILKLSKKTVEHHRGRGYGPVFIKMNNGHVRYRQRDIDAWLESRRRASTTSD